MAHAFYGGFIWATYAHIVPACQDWGLTAEEGASALSTVGICGAIGRVLLGFFADRKGVNKAGLLGACMCVAGLPILLLAVLGGARAPVVIAAFGLFGFFSGSVVAQVPPLLLSLFGSANVPIALGSQYVVQVPFVIALPSFIGWLRAVQGSYSVGMSLCGAAFILAPLAIISLVRMEMAASQ